MDDLIRVLAKCEYLDCAPIHPSRDHIGTTGNERKVADIRRQVDDTKVLRNQCRL